MLIDVLPSTIWAVGASGSVVRAVPAQAENRPAYTADVIL